MKSVAIIGGGESGVGAALLAKKSGLDVFLSDNGNIDDKSKVELISKTIPFEEGGHDLNRLLVADVVVKSPGVPDHAPALRMLKEKGRKVISEIEFGYLFYSGLTIGITGSNGKTTTSGLLYHVLHHAGLDVELGGNYGKSFARILSERQPKYMVLEVSSFQLDDIETFAPHISMLLNITPDHLDRYHYNMDEYAAAKFNIAAKQTADDYFIYNGDDPEIMSRLSTYKLNVQKIPVTRNQYDSGLRTKDGSGFYDFSLLGRHNLLNGQCVVEACRILGLSENQINDGLSSFVNLPHRLEPVASFEGVSYINDSKATNVDSVFYALEAMNTPTIWIAGGTDKGNDYEVLKPLVREKVKVLICLGIDNDKLKQSFEGIVPVILETRSVTQAVSLAHNEAEKGDVVLLSPACASFDLFKNYMDRGDQFKEAVLSYQKILEI
ncbi:MAG: UDP-N-acetylmuramoyl-L-alanine--D-glutamate ligase [Saprospiraceae bacterium]|nr:UDP-N-acetylmuramoyl-L-alanine--D-glutamate ligase [Saprospiraceae bacterium]